MNTQSSRSVSIIGLTVVLFLIFQFSNCSSSSSSGVSIGPNDPFAGLTVSQTIQAPQGYLQYPVEIIRDTYGIPHIYGRTITDVAFAEGYAEASDRLFEMDMFRHIADGTLTEYFGAGPNNTVLNEDIHSRMMGFYNVAQIVYAQTSPDLQAILQSFCNGVNFYLTQLANQVQADPNAKVLPVQYSTALMGITISDIKPFTPQDIIAFGKFESYSLTMEDEGTKIYATHYFNSASTTFTSTSSDSGLAHFAGLAYDFARSEPSAKAPAIAVPNQFSYATSTTYSMLSFNNAKTLNTQSLITKNNTSAIFQPLQINQKAIQGALSFYKSLHNGPFGFLYKPREAGEIGSNNWVISPSLTKDGYAILANDTHLPLYNPPIWYEVHINTATIGKGNINTIGVVFPLAPGVVIGHNDYIAWGDTVFPSDVIDVYQETVVPGQNGNPDSVLYNNNLYPIQAVPITFNFGGAMNGNKVTSGTYTMYYVTIPDHGTMPIYPGSYTPGSTSALAFTWTGFIPSDELQAFYGIDQAQNLDQFIKAQSYFKVGSQNFVYADIYGNIYMTDQSAIPVRGAYVFSYTTNVLPSGLTFSDFTYPPYLVLPGTDPNFYWAGTVPTQSVPYVLNPAQGYIATANQDPVGVTYNNEPLDNPYYLGGFFDPGFRAWEIDRDIQANKGNIDLSYVQNVIQADHTDTYALQILPFLQQAYTDLQGSIPANSPTATAMGYLNAWSSSNNTHPYDTPTGLSPSATTEDINNTIATSIFEAFVQRLFYNIFYDKLQAINRSRAINDDIIINTLLTVLEHPTQCATYSPSELHSTLLDALVKTGSGYTFTQRSLDIIMIQSLSEGISDLSASSQNDGTGSPTSFGTMDMSKWQWGKLHTLTFTDLLNLAAGSNLFPNFNLPNNGTGYPRPGSMFSVDPGTFGFEMGNGANPFYTNYTYGSGPAIRFSVEMKPGDIVGYNVLPGGESELGPDPSNPPKHYGDQVNLWINNQVHPQWFYPKDIIAHAESRTIFMP